MASSQSDENEPTFYEYPISPFSQSVSIALAEADVKYDYNEFYVNLRYSGKTWYLRSEIPTLRVEDGTLITDWLSIIEYIADRFADRAALMPRDPLLRARVRSLIHFYDLGIRTMFFQLLCATDPAEQNMLKGEICWELKGFNDLLAKQRQCNAEEGPYFLGK
ncbi:hypothetical protein EV182_008252, partial [Spiromyces aspiralis]